MVKRALIGVCGAAGAGKDTLASGIRHKMPALAQYSLASPLKNMLTTLLGDTNWDDRAWKEAKIDALGVSPRFLAQTLGTEWGRNAVCDDFWLKIASRHIEKLPDYCSGVVIPDVRFDNEAVWLKNQGGILLKVVRPASPVAIDNQKHSSEGGISPEFIDAELENREGAQQTTVLEAMYYVRRLMLTTEASKHVR